MSLSFNLILFVRPKTRALLTKILSVVSVVVVAGMMIIGCITFKPKKFTFDDFINFRTQKNLISIILLMSAFRYNREILQVSTAGKRVSDLGNSDKAVVPNKHWLAKMIYFTLVAVVVGLVFYITYLENY